MRQDTLAQIFASIDLTTLSGNEQESDLMALAQVASHGSLRVAALCVYPQFIQTLRAYAPKGMPIAAVTNFPHGGMDLDQADMETRQAVALGAEEIDYVLPYKALIAGDHSFVMEALSRQREACGTTKLKVIIESGALQTNALIAQASEICLDVGADFIKTSTGKIAVNATLEAARIMMEVIKAGDNNMANGGRGVGFKAAGGIKTAEQAEAYLKLGIEIWGADQVGPDRFRIGASSLLAELKSQMV